MSSDLPPPAPEDRLVRAELLALKSPVPARLGKIIAGCAGWTDPTLIKSKRFYPRGVSKSEDRLRFYATQFAMVEIDSTYYALPPVDNARRWVDRTPNEFVFNVKAFGALTEHPIDLVRLPRDLQEIIPSEIMARGRAQPRELPESVLAEIWNRFRAVLEPLAEANKLGSVLLQFPPWFSATKAHAEVIEKCRERLAEFPLAVEFRHASWAASGRFTRVLDMLRRLEMSFVAVDEPQGLPNSMPPTVAVTNPKLAIVRFHGHRTETWNESVSVHQKFGYLYDPPELIPWVEKARQLAASAEQVHLVFNNCLSNYAVLGAKDVMALAAELDAAR